MFIYKILHSHDQKEISSICHHWYKTWGVTVNKIIYTKIGTLYYHLYVGFGGDCQTYWNKEQKNDCQKVCQNSKVCFENDLRI